MSIDLTPTEEAAPGTAGHRRLEDVPDLAALSMCPCVCVWPWVTLPHGVREALTEIMGLGGDEDFVVWVPDEVDAEEAALAVDRLTYNTAHKFQGGIQGGTLYVCVHA